MDPRLNPFLNKARLAQILEVGEPGQPELLARYLFIVGVESLLAGESRQAIEALERMRALIDGGVELDEQSRRSVLEMLALSYLRLGEQENCVARPSSDRCLLPIRGDGVHSLEAGSRGAIEVYLDLLTLYPEDLKTRWLLNLAFMTLGEHPAKVPARFLIPEAGFASEADQPRFVEVAAQVGVDVLGLAGGVVADDFDGDGRLDLVTSSWGLSDPLRFFRNGGDGGFIDESRAFGLEGIVGGLNLSHADYDNDGRPDVLVLRGAWLREMGRMPNSLLRNVGGAGEGQTRFVDVTEEAGLASRHPTQVGVWGDYDNDGWLDLFVGNETMTSSYHPAELFHNNGDGTFDEVAALVGLEAAVPIKGAAWGDIDNDGLIDLYVSNNNGDNLLFHNRGPATPGGWSFVERAAEAGVREPRVSFPTWFWDYDNDGWQDLFVSAYSGGLSDLAGEYLGLGVAPDHRPRLYRNNRDGTFTDVATRVGLDRVLVTMGANFGDYDNDGFLDFYAGTGNTQMETLMPNRMFRNAAGRAFQDITASGGLGHLQKGHGIAFADLDHDGDQDVYAVMGGSHSGDGFHNALFRNPGNDHHWISIELVGRSANRSAIGARLHLEIDTPEGRRAVYRTIGGGGSFGANPLRAEIGLGRATAIEKLEIRWPGDAATQRISGLERDRFYRVRQGDAGAVELQRPSFPLGKSSGAAAADHHQP